jgi:tRNA dimethylallyltransferase
MRAYEVKFYTKKSLYEWSSKTKSEFLEYDIKKFFINTPRDVIIKYIEKRTNQMFKNSCVKEVENFIKLKSDKSLSPHKLIGVKEISDYLSGNLSLKATKELIKIKTRQYAKRQNTWSRGHMKNWNKLYFKGLPILANKILKAIS